MNIKYCHVQTAERDADIARLSVRSSSVCHAVALC